MLDEYIASLTAGLMTLGVEQPLAQQLATLGIYAVVLNTVCAIVVLIGRRVGAIRVVNSVGDKAFVAAGGLFFAYAVYAVSSNWASILGGLAYLNPSFIGKVVNQGLRNPMEGFLLVGMLAILALALWVLFKMLKGCVDCYVALFAGNIQANGVFVGVLLSLYESLSGIFWLALIACAFSVGIAIILLPFMLALASLHGTDVIYIEEDL